MDNSRTVRIFGQTGDKRVQWVDSNQGGWYGGQQNYIVNEQSLVCVRGLL